ncbi:FecR family protein [Chitinophaga sp. sic0106]|uniref:FecR family protein n=1 Tax=Chitinophaga sp. sic0106 TaxID=2854785 RepID=UPI001C4500E3|nr:FecR domain-containing protein [Chitinophaga sp. sic0106]MBV7529943.1 FecR domain-containing protein [Chitinophaga sp. sic0106]
MNSKTDIDIVIRYLEHPENEQSKRLLNDWIQQDPANLDIFLDMRDMWNGDPLPAASAFDTQGQWSRFSDAVDMLPVMPAEIKEIKAAPAATPKVRKMPVRYWWAAAAVAAIAVSMVYLGPGKYKTYATHQQIDSVKLTDGSTVYLNANTVVKVPRDFGKTSRNVTIAKGEAFFDVAQQESQPFTVDAPDVAIRVLGTSFNVKSADNNVKVFVQTGKVSAAYKHADKNVILTPGLEASLQRNSDNIHTTEHKKSTNILAWKTRCLVFDESPLSEVAAALQDYYHVQVDIKDPKLADARLLATFRDLPLDEVLDIIRKALQINIKHENNLVEFY